MPSDLAPLDVVAFVWFIASWVGFTIIQDHLLRDRQGVNQHLKIVRRHWMEQMLQRENRIMDSQLFGHTMHSCTFFRFHQHAGAGGAGRILWRHRARA